MDSLRKVEEDLRSLGVEFRKLYPEVSDATEHALATLKTMREMYVADKMRRSGVEKEDVRIPRSSDIVAPYILACNYADASPKLLLQALNGIQMLVSFEMAPPADVKNLLRVFAIQAASGRSELQLKILQMLLHVGTQLASSEELCSYLTPATLRGFFSLLLDLCCEAALSVSTTALATLRQVVAIVLDPLSTTAAASAPAVARTNSREVKEGFAESALAFVGDLSLFARGQPGEWCRGVLLPQAAAFDLLDYTLNGWKDVFQTAPAFRAYVQHTLFPVLKALLRDLQEDFATHVARAGVATASARTSRAVCLARTFLLSFSVCDGFLDEVDTVANLLVHTMTSDYDVEPSSTGRGSHGSSGHSCGDERDTYKAETPTTSASMMGGASALIGGLARFQMPFGASKEKDKPLTGSAALQAAYVPLSGSTSGGSYLASPQSQSQAGSGSKPMSRLLAHPAGACLEALLSFFILNMEPVLALQGGRDVVARTMVSTVQGACTLLVQALGVSSNVSAFVAAAGGSKAITALESFLSGSASDSEAVVRSMHEGLLNAPTIGSADMLILAFYAAQVVSRQLVDFSLVAGGAAQAHREAHVFIGASSAPAMVSCGEMSPELVGVLAHTVASAVHDSVQEVCIAVLAAVDYPLLVRRSVGVLSELALIAGLLQLQRPCEAAVSALCRFTVPTWHGEGMEQLPLPPALQRSGSGSFSATAPAGVGDSGALGSVVGVTLRWKHVQAIVRLSQTVHVLANVLSDWDSVVDAFEQITDCILDPKTAHADDVTSADVDCVLSSLERFKQYTVFLSDTALTKLMMSLVAMSLNNLAVTKSIRSTSSGGNSGSGADDWRAARVTDTKMAFSVKSVPPGMPSYMIDGASAGLVSFSLQATVEVAKYNTHRSQCVWQMVTSHLKMVAGLKSSVIRGVAVAGTFDLIGGMLAFLHAPQAPSVEAVDGHGGSKGAAKPSQGSKRGVNVSDDVLFTKVMPSFQSNFLPQRMHTEALQAQAVKTDVNNNITLSQNDILAASKVLAGIRFDDVRAGVMQGLLTLLQGGGDALSQDGWSSVLALISVAPASLLPSLLSSSSAATSTASLTTADAAEDAAAFSEASKWPVAAVAAAFDCMKLVLDEYLASIELGSMSQVITCLSLFSSQLLDVNISLTSLELLWKVYDTTMRGRGSGSDSEGHEDKQKQQIFNITTTQLLGLALDTRPEIRHCAMNTLFAALTMTANASLTTGEQWQQIFNDVIFPLFARAGERSTQAIASKEEANAPELKRGKKMVLHHSRDTAHKQWSQTRVLALRGLARVVKTCAVQLIQEDWFRTTWATALQLCKKAVEGAAVDQEVALASFEVMFSMLNIMSEKSFAAAVASSCSSSGSSGGSQPSGEGGGEKHKNSVVQTCRTEMWGLTWTAVKDASKIPHECPDVALAVCQGLLSIYEDDASGEFEFASKAHLRDVCDCLVTLSRPRLLLCGEGSQQKSSGVVDMQLYRLLVGFLKVLQPRDAEAVSIVGSAVVELCFANQYVQLTCPLGDGRDERVLLGPCPEKFRLEVGEFFSSTFLKECVTPTAASMRTHGLIVLDTVFKRFITDICGLAISYRSESVHTLSEQVTPVKGAGSAGDGGSGGSGSGGGRRTTNRGGASVRKKGQLGFFSFLAGAIDGSDVDDESSGSGEDADADADADVDVEEAPQTPGGQGFSGSGSAEPKTPGPPRSELNFHVLKQCEAPGKSDSSEWTSFYPLAMELKLLTRTLRHCLTESNFSSVDEATRENIFSTFLCFFSPWRTSELPGTKESFGPFVQASHAMAAPLMEALEVIHAFAAGHPRSNWTVALVSTLADATRLQIQAVVESNQQQANSEAEIVSMLGVWRKVAEILSSVAAGSAGVASRRIAIDAILKIARDVSYGVLDRKKCPYSKSVLNEGCMIFCRCLLQLESNLDDTPKSFNGRKAQETEMLQSWLVNMTDPPVEEEWRKSSDRDDEESFSKQGHLFIFLPIAFKLLQCDCEDIKDIVLIITSTVDIAALINSYSDLQSQVMTHQASSPTK